MFVSQETHKETELRLIQVLQETELKIYEQHYFFQESPVQNFKLNPKALAVVRDDEVWSQLIPINGNENEAFNIFRFHFKEGFDNSGFVGWLASKIKKEFGSGVFIVCGQNSKHGGIFDYWGCPIEIADKVLGLVNDLRRKE